MLELNKENFYKEISNGKVVVDNWAIWCAPCRMMAPVFEALSKELKNVKFAKLNVDDNPEIASKYNIMSIPTFLIFKNGEPVKTLVGVMPKEKLKSEIEKV